MTIMVIGAHPDDEVLGAGGTMAKYAAQGHKIVTVTFSKGEASHPWLAKDKIHAYRIDELDAALKILGCHVSHFLDVADGKFKQEVQRPQVKKTLKSLINRYKPEKIFTHTLDDTLYGHKEVHKLVIEIIKEMKTTKKTPQVWGFNIWTINVRQRDLPRLIVDISDTFSKKKRALACFHSQRVALYQLMPFVYAKAFFTGIDNDVNYAESFVRLF